MLKINALRIEIITEEETYGIFQKFENGLNIVRGNNSSGKSTMFQSILYSLGLEELIGGKNERPMQTVLKDTVEFPQESFHKILQSYVYLEIENKEVITIKRSIVSPSNSPKLVEVFFGAYLTGTDHNLRKQSMYIHDSGGASDETYGFHLFLSEFLGWQMPEVQNTKGQTVNLYIQQIASSFLIEQKSGWSDFYATMPYYAIKQAVNRVFEFVLKMDVFETQKKKQEINYKLDELSSKWENVFLQAENIAHDTKFSLQGLGGSPALIKVEDICLLKNTELRTIDLSHELQSVREEIESLNKVQIQTVGETLEQHEMELKCLQNQLSEKSVRYDEISTDLALYRQQIVQYTAILNDIVSDLKKNKSALKVIKLGGNIGSALSEHICPTCHQKIENSLLPGNVHEETMGLDENIQYLEGKKRMVEKFIVGQKHNLRDKENVQKALNASIAEIRSQIRSIKEDLLQDRRTPSVADIEHRLKLKQKCQFFEKKINEFESLKLILADLIKEYKNILAEKQALGSECFTDEDLSKIDDFEKTFVESLSDFEYDSKPVSTIKISREDYLPLTQLSTGEIYNIRFDSSASDFIRCLWAYYTSLMQVSLKHAGNHPGLLMFDEPKQQDVSEQGFHVFLKKLSEFKQEQIIVFASFENKDESFASATEDLDFNLIRIEDKLIKPM